MGRRSLSHMGRQTTGRFEYSKDSDGKASEGRTQRHRRNSPDSDRLSSRSVKPKSCSTSKSKSRRSSSIKSSRSGSSSTPSDSSNSRSSSKSSRHRRRRHSDEERRRANHQRKNAYHRVSSRREAPPRISERKTSRQERSTIEIDNLSKNVQDAHLKHIFGIYAKSEIKVERHPNDCSRALIHLFDREDAEYAYDHLA